MLDYIKNIKKDRELSFSNWRYRLLHWTFNVKAKTPSESSLPNFLYDHYCPLFHTTNILAVLFPLVVLIKLILALKYVFLFPIVAFKAYLDRIEEEQSKDPVFLAKEAKKKRSKEIERVRALFKAVGYDKAIMELYFLNYLSEEDAMQILDNMKKKAEEQKEAKEVRKKELSERFVFWIRFSEIFVKGLTVTVVAAAALVLMYFLVTFVPLAWAATVWLFIELWSLLTSASFFGFLDFVLRVVVVALSLLVMFVVTRPLFVKFCKFVETPISIAKDCINNSLDSLCKFFVSCSDFVSALYEDNCPAITIVEEDELGAE